MRTLVLGLGNELAGDDGVGPLAARALAERLAREGRAHVAEVVESSASGLTLLEALTGHERAIVIDAIRTGRRPPGTIVEMSLRDVGRVVAPSTHQAGLAELAAVAERLGLAFPSSAWVLAVEVMDPFTLGAGLSAPVAAAVPELVRRAHGLVLAWAHEEDPCTTSTPSRS